MNTKSIVSTIAVCLACAVAVNTHAASDFLLEIEGVKGESKATASKPGAQAANRAVVGPSSGATSNATGGVRVATGDVDGDGKSASAQNANRALAPAQKPPSAMLLPAVQKAREAASK